MSVVPDLKMLTSVHIGGPPIEVLGPLTAMLTLSCKNTKKPSKAKWLHGEGYPIEIDIESNSCGPWMLWRMSNKIR